MRIAINLAVISHDRAGFGGGLCSIGSLLLFMARCADLTRSFVEVVALMGLAGFGCAIGVHFAVGYLDFVHLLPAFVGLLIFIIEAVLLWSGRSSLITHANKGSELLGQHRAGDKNQE